MKTEDIIKELELNYGYTFAKEGTDNKWQFEWICEMINDVQNVVTKNCNLYIVSGSSLDVAKQIPQVPQTQMALNDQLRILRIAANKLGLYDAADFIKCD